MMLWVEERRGFAIEATHAIDAVACSASGEVSVLSGVDAVTTFRSAAKPFQLAGSFALLEAAQQAAVSARELALGTASHHGEPVHLEALAALFEKLGCSESDLYCGAHLPLHPPSARALLARGEAPSARHHNCAGKHAFMAAAARAQAADRDYRPADHPVQRRILDELARHTAHAVVGSVVDGCGAPCFVLPLSAMARAYAGLARVTATDAPDEADASLAQIGRAMRAHPLLVSGTEAFDGWLMQHTEVIAKVGAGGLLCIAVPRLGMGLAVKVRTGSELVRPAATAALLASALPGLLSEPLPARYLEVRNAAGALVGAIVTRSEAD